MEIQWNVVNTLLFNYPMYVLFMYLEALLYLLSRFWNLKQEKKIDLENKEQKKQPNNTCFHFITCEAFCTFSLPNEVTDK